MRGRWRWLDANDDKYAGVEMFRVVGVREEQSRLRSVRDVAAAVGVARQPFPHHHSSRHPAAILLVVEECACRNKSPGAAKR